MNTRFYYHPLFLEHDTGPHPERPERLMVILSHLKNKGAGRFETIEPRRAEHADGSRVHDPVYLEHVEKLCRQGGGNLDGDTPVSARSFDAALHATGALLDGADALMEGRTRSAFALVRPPGHHARPGHGMGFCLINHVAAAAAYLKARHGLDRLLIVDFDVHHGNGTQEIFYQDASVFFLSIHRYPFYPGTGGAEEVGEGEGEGYTLNVPVSADTPPDETMAAFALALDRAVERQKPQLILVSAGFDAFAEDPVGGLGLLPEHFLVMGSGIRRAADHYGSGKVLSTLEGGYSLAGLPLCLEAYVDGLD